MVAVARGNLASMSELYQRRHRSLFRFFFRLTGRQALAEDLVHEVFLRMIRYRETWQHTGANDSGAFEAWMYRIALNTLVDHSLKNRHEIPSGEDQLEAVPS